MKPKELLVSFDGWGADVTKDLQEMESDIYVLPLLGENADSILYIYKVLYAETYRQEALESIGWMCEFLGSSSPETGFAIADEESSSYEKHETIMEFVAVRELKRLIEAEQEFLSHNAEYSNQVARSSD